MNSLENGRERNTGYSTRCTNVGVLSANPGDAEIRSPIARRERQLRKRGATRFLADGSVALADAATDVAKRGRGMGGRQTIEWYKMVKTQTHTLIYAHGGPLLMLYRVWFAPLGFPFVTDCCVAGSPRSMIPLWRAVGAVDIAGEQKALGKTFEIQIRGTMRKRHFTREEQKQSERDTADILDAFPLPAWRWEVAIHDVITVRELHWSKEPWFGLPAILYVLCFIALLTGGIGSCIRNW